MTLCSGDKIMVYDENKEKRYHVEEVTEEYVKLSNDVLYNINETMDLNDESIYVMSSQSHMNDEKDSVTKMVVHKMQNVKHLSYEKAIKILEILMDLDSED